MSDMAMYRQLKLGCACPTMNTGCSVSNNEAGESTIIAVGLRRMSMRLQSIASVLLLATSVSAVPNSPFLSVNQTKKNGKTELVVKNVSHRPIVAYVVIVDSPDHRSVYHGVYTGKDALAAGKTATIGEVAPTDVKVSIDYVRLADGTTWGAAATDDAKEISSRFR